MINYKCKKISDTKKGFLAIILIYKEILWKYKLCSLHFFNF